MSAYDNWLHNQAEAPDRVIAECEGCSEPMQAYLLDEKGYCPQCACEREQNKQLDREIEAKLELAVNTMAEAEMQQAIQQAIVFNTILEQIYAPLGMPANVQKLKKPIT